jgi:hypothetical protein
MTETVTLELNLDEYASMVFGLHVLSELFSMSEDVPDEIIRECDAAIKASLRDVYPSPVQLEAVKKPAFEFAKTLRSALREG